MFLQLQPGDRGTEVRRGIVPELHDPGMALERCLHDAALDASPAPVNQTDLSKTCSCGGVHVLVDYRRDVAGCKCMQIELGLNGHAVHGMSP